MGSIEEDIVHADTERRDRFIKQLHTLLDLRAAVARTEIVLALDPECVRVSELLQQRKTQYREALESFETWKGLL